MPVKSLQINNLRNIQSAEIEPHPHVNIFFGANGAGKTSVIESLVVLAKGRSFRSGNTSALIGPNGDSFQVVAEIAANAAPICRMGLERSANEWRARINGIDVKQLSDLAPQLPFILVEPNSHQLVSRSPDIRRRYIDWGVFHV